MKLVKITLSKEQALILKKSGGGRDKIAFSSEHNLKGKMCKFGSHLWYLEDATEEEKKEFAEFILDCITSPGWHGYLDW